MHNIEKNIIYIATLSGGKDSTVQTDLLLKNGYPVDYIIFYDTLQEFKSMYVYIDKLKEYFRSRYNKEVIVTKPKSTFEDWCYGKINKKGALYDGYIRGIPMVWSEPCYWRRESKVKAFDDLIKELNIKEHKIYIGYTNDEKNRVMKEDKFIYPLIDYFNMSEFDCKKYLLDQEMENPLYKNFNRTGCRMCPAQSKKSWFNVWKYFNEDWQYMKIIEDHLNGLELQGNKIKNKYWFPNFKTTNDYENEFIKLDQRSLFNFSDEPLKDCFCKI